jgi:hypothetical protein
MSILPSQGCFLAMYCNWHDGVITGVYNINNSIAVKNQLNLLSK